MSQIRNGEYTYSTCIICGDDGNITGGWESGVYIKSPEKWTCNKCKQNGKAKTK